LTIEDIGFYSKVLVFSPGIGKIFMGTRQSAFKLKQILEQSNYRGAHGKLKLRERTTSGLGDARSLV